MLLNCLAEWGVVRFLAMSETRDQTSGYSGIVLRGSDDRAVVRIRSALLREVVNSLPDGPTRESVLAWTRRRGGESYDRKELEAAICSLAEVAFTAKEGQRSVGRLAPCAVPGEVLGTDDAQFGKRALEPLAAAIVLSLALRRLLLLESVGCRIESEDGEADLV